MAAVHDPLTPPGLTEAMRLLADPGFQEPAPGFVPPAPADSADRLARLRLIRSRRVGPVTFQRLLSEHGSAARALEALPGIASAAGVADYSICPEGVALAEMKAAKHAGAQMLCLGDAAYPAALATISDAPPVLWALGDTGLLARPAVAMVGTRNASSLGARMARRLAADLSAAGFVVISGLARGIDALAHAAALEGGTVGVQAGGLDVIYPVENTDLAVEMARRGLRLSEQPFGLQPQARHFPRRNRIVSGLAQAVIVVEAAARSGSLITARMALEQGREVLAVPGHPMDPRASGCNILIRDGAGLVRGAADVIEAMSGAGGTYIAPDRNAATGVVGGRYIAPDATGPDPLRPVRKVAASDGLPARILSHLGPAPMAEDQLIRDLGLPPAIVTGTLAEMELAGSVERRPGGLLALAG